MRRSCSRAWPATMPTGPTRGTTRGRTARSWARKRSAISRALRLGVLSNLARAAVEPGVEAAFQRAVAASGALGADVRDVTLPSYDVVQGRRAVFVRVEVDAAAVHGPLYRREPERFSAEMRGYLDWGLSASAVRFAEADRVIEVAAHELRCALQAWTRFWRQPRRRRLFLCGQGARHVGDFCVLANMAGCPAISLPMGLSGDGLPLGLQIMAPAGQDQRVLAIASAYEAVAKQTLCPPPPYGPLAGPSTAQ